MIFDLIKVLDMTVIDRFIFLFLIALAIVLYTPQLSARTIGSDQGLLDSILIDSAQFRTTDTIKIPVRIYIDNPLSALEITLKQNSTELIVDSASFIGTDLNYINIKGFAKTDSTITLFAFISDEAYISLGYHLAGFIFLSSPSPPTPQILDIDTTTTLIVLVERANYFTDTLVISFVPQVRAESQVIEFVCCVGVSGNIDNSAGEIVDIGDLTALISFLFIDPLDVPVCLDEANIDGSADRVVDIGDLTQLIAYLFIDPIISPLAACR